MCFLKKLYAVWTLSSLCGWFWTEASAVHCGRRSVSSNSRIVGGTNASPGRWPWQAYITRFYGGGGSDTFLCAGAVINEKWVVVASQCMWRIPIEYTAISVGVYDIQNIDENVQRLGVSGILFSPDSSMALMSGVCLLEVDGEMNFTPYVSPVCLPSQDADVDGRTNCWVTGWGCTDANVIEQSNILQEAYIPRISVDDCQVDPFYEIVPFFCTEYQDIGSGACPYDSGDPLVCQEPPYSDFYLYGINAFATTPGSDYTHPNATSYYVPVSSYTDWIINNTGGYTG